MTSGNFILLLDSKSIPQLLYIDCRHKREVAVCQAISNIRVKTNNRENNFNGKLHVMKCVGYIYIYICLRIVMAN